LTNPEQSFRFAVIADAHFHDTSLDLGTFGFPVDGERLVIRPLGDVARSPRVYNEAGQALRFALDRIAAAGIRDVVLLGDYSDDGQAATLAALERVLSDYRRRHGLRFYAVPGNHDIFGENGRHRRKRYLREDGGLMLVTSDPDFEPERGARRIVHPGMYCGGYPENLPEDCSFFGAAEADHWETPFGSSPDPSYRLYDVSGPDGTLRRRLMDASYLVEPAPGIWFAMVDANVFVPDSQGEDGLQDSTSAGWKAMLRHKPFILDWLADLSRRAAERGKRLFVFSHYPVLDPLDGTLGQELAMMEEGSFHARIPPREPGEALLKTGIRVHFSGHVHVNDTASLEGENGEALVNIAVPALVAFPTGFKVVSVLPEHVRVEHVSLGSMPLQPVLMEAYRLEQALTGVETGGMRDARTYGEFLIAHIRHVTRRRFLKREWPADLAALFRERNLGELARLAGLALPPAVAEQAAAVDGIGFLSDWYCLRMGSDLAFEAIGPERISLYRALATLPPSPEPPEPRLALLIETLKRHLDGLPATDIRMDWRTGAVSPPRPATRSS
jgi:3',5'-cyclic AMP phosphodiesterase CpdA